MLLSKTILSGAIPISERPRGRRSKPRDVKNVSFLLFFFAARLFGKKPRGNVGQSHFKVPIQPTLIRRRLVNHRIPLEFMNLYTLPLFCYAIIPLSTWLIATEKRLLWRRAETDILGLWCRGTRLRFKVRSDEFQSPLSSQLHFAAFPEKESRSIFLALIALCKLKVPGDAYRNKKHYMYRSMIVLQLCLLQSYLAVFVLIRTNFQGRANCLSVFWYSKAALRIFSSRQTLHKLPQDKGSPICMTPRSRENLGLTSDSVNIVVSQLA